MMFIFGYFTGIVVASCFAMFLFYQPCPQKTDRILTDIPASKTVKTIRILPGDFK